MPQYKPINPMALALLSAGTGILGASGNRNASTGQILSAGLGQAGMGMAQAQAMNQHTQLQNALMEQRQREEDRKAAADARQQRQRGFTEQYVQSLPEAERLRARAIGPQAYASGRMKKEMRSPTAFDFYTSGDPEKRALAEGFRQSGADRTNVQNVIGKGQTKIAETIATGYGKFAESVYADADNAANRIDGIRRVNDLLQGVTTGPGTQSIAQAQALFNRLAPGTFDPAKIASIDSARAEAGQLVMKELNAMKGPATENERDYLREITIDVSMTPGTRSNVEYVASRQAQRAAELSNYAADVSESAENGEISASRARKLIREHRAELIQQDDETFDPPFSVAPEMEGSEIPDDIKAIREKYGR